MTRVLIGSVICLLALGVRAPADEADCSSCHAVQALELADSVHKSLRCQECHGGTAGYDLSEEQVRSYEESVGQSRPPFDHGPSFTGRTPRSAVPTLCGNCHADIERMNVYNIRTDQLARYWTSGHGKTLRGGDDRVAVCTDCHGVHSIHSGRDLRSSTHPFNVPDTCAVCHADFELMGEYNLSAEVVDEYRHSVHGDLLLNLHDSGAPNCATCHGNHSATPPGFATVGAVCGQCHQGAAEYFNESVHATLEEGHKGCVQCHGGGEDRHFHLIERITKPSGVLIERYAHLLASESSPTPEQVSEAINPSPKQIITRALPTCTDCHDTLEEDESLPKLFTLIDAIAAAERRYVETANRLDELGRGVLLVENQRFTFQDAKTHLIGLAPLQHTLDNEKVATKVKELEAVCAQVNGELDGLERDLRLRKLSLIPIWAFSLVFAWMLHAKFKQLKKAYVKPLPSSDRS